MKLSHKLSMVAAVLFVLSGVCPSKVQALSEDSLTAPSAVLMDAASGEVLFAKNPHEVRACASITKIMTVDLVMEALDEGLLQWDDTVTASEHAASMGGSDIWLEPGETMSVRDMLKATMIASANDAAVALAEHLCGSEEEFVEKMNEKAKALSMNETVFKNCNGLDEEGHVTSAYDVALMSRDLLRHPSVLQFSTTWMDELRGGKTQLVNTNKLIKSYSGITGLKTGTTSQAGSCVSATAERDGVSLIAVVLGSASGKERFSDAARLLDDGFAHYAMASPEAPAKAFTQIPVSGGMSETVSTFCKKASPFLVKKGEEGSIVEEVTLPESVPAPVHQGDVLGQVVYKKGGEQIAEIPITAAQDVEEMTTGKVFRILVRLLAGEGSAAHQES